MGLVQIHNGQHHEQVGLQRDDQDVEHCPAEMQGQLPVANQTDHQEYYFAGEEVTVESQCQRHRFGQEARQFQNQVERDGPLAEGMEGELTDEATHTLDLDAVEDDEKENTDGKAKGNVQVGG